MTTTPADLQAMLHECERKFQTVRDRFPTLTTGDVIDSGDGPLTVFLVTYAPGSWWNESTRQVVGTPALVVATADGRNADWTKWHDGPAADDEWVRYERWTPAGRVAHGWIHKASRRLLQTG